MKFIWALFIALAVGIPAFAQTPVTRFPVPGTVIKASPVFWSRDTNRTSIVLLPAGTTVLITGRSDPWYRIVFQTPAGEQTGFMAPYDIRIDPDAAPPAGTRTRVLSERGFLEGRAIGFPQTSPTDATRTFFDGLLRQEVFLKPARWLQFAGGLDVRGSSHDQVDSTWQVDFRDRGTLRPRIGVRRLTATLNSSHFTLDLGKQLIRWGMTDVLSPTDRFAPRDYLSVIDSEFLPVTGARASINAGSERFEIVVVPEMTPSRLPLLTQRWAVIPSAITGVTVQDNGAVFPSSSQQGLRWSHVGRFEVGLSVFDGFNHLPEITAEVNQDLTTVSLTRTYPRLRTYGGEIMVPTRAFTLKGEAAYFTSPTSVSDDYVLYVFELERQVGEWLFDVGYAGELVTEPRADQMFSAERGMARSVIGRVAYTVDPRRTLAVEGAARQNGRGVYAKGEFSQTFGQHWRLTLAAAGIAGEDDDFLGQYHRNSNASATFRLSF